MFKVYKELTFSSFDSKGAHPKSKHVISPSSTRAVSQGEAGITQHNSAQPLVGSFGAGPCVIVSVYNTKTRVAGLSHVDAVANPWQALALLSYQATKDGEGILEVDLATSQPDDNETLEKLKTKVLESDGMKLRKIHTSRSLVIDSRTSRTYSGIDPKQMDLGKDINRRMESRGNEAMFSFGKKVNIRLVFDGRDNILPAKKKAPSSETFCGFKPGFLLGKRF